MDSTTCGPRRDKMPQKVEGWNKRYQQIGNTCDEANCAPCTYPSCQRFVREKKATKRVFAK
jgi:hypothetical protein